MSQTSAVASTKPTYLTADSSDSSWQPFVLGSEAVGEWKPLRVDEDGTYMAGFWRNLDGQNGEFDFEVPSNKLTHVIQGRIKITINGSETVELSAGESVALHSCSTHWEVLERPYLDMFVIS